MRKNKSTSFNLDDMYEKELLEHAEKQENGNFSRYVKRLIVRDRENGGRSVLAHSPPPNIIDNVADKEVVSDMSSFL